MRTALIILIATLPLSGFAQLEIISSGDAGPTFVDPFNNSASFNFKSNLDGGLEAKYTCRKDDTGQPANYFFLTRMDEKNPGQKIQETVLDQARNLSCTDIKKIDSNVCECETSQALEISLSGKGNPVASSPQVSNTQMNLGGVDLQNQINSCSPDQKRVIFKNGDSYFNASLKEKSICTLEKRRISLDRPWNKDSRYDSQVYTSPDSKPGFSIGNHTQYYFDDTKKSWCIKFIPDPLKCNTEPTCSATFTNRTFPISFEAGKVNKGVVRLSVDPTTNNPVAYIGEGKFATSDTTTGAPRKLDGSKPLLKVTLTNDPTEGRRTIFQPFDNYNGTNPGRPLVLAPTYSYGDEFSDKGFCDESSCLNPSAGFASSDDLATKKLCSKNDAPFNLDTDLSQPLCYSCNGVTPGVCGNTKSVINKNNYRTFMNKLTSCKEPKTISVPTVEPVAQ